MCRYQLTNSQHRLQLHSAMHIAAWRGKFKLLAYLTNYGGDPMKKNKQGETAFESGKKYPLKLKWYIAQFPEFQTIIFNS